MNTNLLNDQDEDFKKAALDPFWKPLAEMTEDEKAAQALKSNIWIGILSDNSPQMNQEIRQGLNLEDHWNKVSIGVRLLEWHIAYRKSLGESASNAERAMKSLFEVKHLIMEQIGK
jgi:hypothetical protein